MILHIRGRGISKGRARGPLLVSPAPISFLGGVDPESGIIVEKGANRAVFLPEVAVEQGWSKEETLRHLSMKAGMGPDDWRKGARFKVKDVDGIFTAGQHSPSLLGEFKKVIGEYVARTGRSLDHMRNFIDCVKSRQRTVANPEVMHHSMTTVHAANICMWLKRDLKYDPAKAEFVNDPEANRLRTRAMREPWII